MRENKVANIPRMRSPGQKRQLVLGVNVPIRIVLHTGGKNACIQGLHGDYIVIF